MDRPLYVLLLSGLEEALSVERATLRQLGVRVRGLAAGRSALALFDGAFASSGQTNGLEGPDLVLCTETLGDMGTTDFLRALRLLRERKGLEHPPVVVVCAEGEREKYGQLGAAATMSRPYTASGLAAVMRAVLEQESQTEHALTATPAAARPAGGAGAAGFFARRQREARQKLAEQINQAGRAAQTSRASQASQTGQTGQSGPELAEMAAAQARAVAKTAAPAAVTVAEAATAKAEPKTANTENPLLHSRKGLCALRAGRLAEAWRELQAALEYDPIDLEACLGLAGVCRRRNNAAGEQRWLNRAAVICLESGQPARAKSIMERLPADLAGANPYLIEARHLLLEKNFCAAANVFLRLSRQEGEAPLHQLLARAAQLTDSPEETLRELCAAFKENGQPVLAADLHRRLLAEPAERPEFEPSSFWTRFPRLYEVMAVARFTVQAFRATS